VDGAAVGGASVWALAPGELQTGHNKNAEKCRSDAHKFLRSRGHNKAGWPAADRPKQLFQSNSFRPLRRRYKFIHNPRSHFYMHRLFTTKARGRKQWRGQIQNQNLSTALSRYLR
jgi:hypothetical protein